MFVFQFKQVKSPETAPVAAFIDNLKKKEGWKGICPLPSEVLLSNLKSRELHMALKNPDKWAHQEKENLIENIEQLKKNSNFGQLLLEAYQSKDGRYTRLFIGDLYNSTTGKKALDKLGIKFGIELFLAGFTKLPKYIGDEERRRDFEYFRYPEDLIYVRELNANQKAAYSALVEYLQTGNFEKKNTFLAYVKKMPQEMSELIQTQDIRVTMEKVLKETESASRLRDLFLSHAGRQLLEPALDTPEGINSIGYLWNTNAGTDFLQSLIDGVLPNSLLGMTQVPRLVIGTPQTLYLIFKKQKAYLEKAEREHKTYRNVPGWENL